MGWNQDEFVARVGLAPYGVNPPQENPKPIYLGKSEIDPATRGIVAILSSAEKDHDNRLKKIQLKYWYRRQNGQSRVIHLFDVALDYDDENEEVIVNDIYYKNKSLIAELNEKNSVAAREILLDTIKDIHFHIREGRSPADVLKTLYDHNVPDIVGEEITLPGIKREGGFFFPCSDHFNPSARGELEFPQIPGFDKMCPTGEINTIDAHRTIPDSLPVYGTNTTTGTTFECRVNANDSGSETNIDGDLSPVVIPFGERARALKGFLSLKFKKARRAANDNAHGQRTLEAFSMSDFQFFGKDFMQEDTDTKLRAMGIWYKFIDMMRRQRFPKILDYAHLYDYLNHIQITSPPPPEGRFCVTSLLGNEKEEHTEGFGYDLGACKVVRVDYSDDQGQIVQENIILDAGILLPPKGSDWDGALPDLVEHLSNCKGIFITHRHLDHMAALVYLAKLGLLRNIPIYGSSRALYILETHMKTEISNKNMLPPRIALQGEGKLHFDRISLEYSVDAMDHSTPSTAYRVIGRKNSKTEDLTSEDVHGSYFFYGDGRAWKKPEFASRGLRGFGIDRQDTLLDVDITNVTKPGRAPTEEEATKNRQDLMSLFPDKGILLGMISTNDTKLNTYYDSFNLAQRNFTAVGHNIQMTLRSHNIHGVDPEYKEVFDKNNINEYLKAHAQIITDERTEKLREAYDQETDEARRQEIFEEIFERSLSPVEYRGRTAGAVKEWIKNPSSMAILVTGTQGNTAELFSTFSKFADGVSVLDTDRHSALKLHRPGEWVGWIDQTAIPGNEDEQVTLINKLITNRGLYAMVVAVENGFKIYGLDEESSQRISDFYRQKGVETIEDNDGSFLVPGVPLHVSGHAYEADILDIVKTVNADINHGTHNNRPEGTAAFHLNVCKPHGQRHTEDQFNDNEEIQIDMEKSSEYAQLTSLGRNNHSIILYKLIRQFGDFFGGTIEAKRITKIDGHTGYDEVGLTAGGANEEFENGVVAVGFADASANRQRRKSDRSLPDEAISTEPIPIRRHKGVERPPPPEINREAILSSIKVA